MADDWKLCADWLVRCETLSRDHPAAKPTGQLQNLAAVLRDGVLICMLLNKLSPGSIDSKDFSQYLQISLVQSTIFCSINNFIYLLVETVSNTKYKIIIIIITKHNKEHTKNKIDQMSYLT